jgi:hypothetical protein
MKVVGHTEDDWRKEHPTGAIAFHHLLKGDPDSRDNFMLVLGRQDADFHMPRHRHNFDQIRLTISGPMNIGDGHVIGEGAVGYFGEGTPYGPQDDPIGNVKPGDRLQLVLQYGGATGYGFMSMEQRLKAMRELQETGTWVGPNYRHSDGRMEWGLNTIWRHVFGEKLKYARPRYQDPVILDPRNFNWLPLRGQTGVDQKFLGAFSERGVWIEFVRVRTGAFWTSTDMRSRRLFFVLSGTGTAADSTIARFSAIQVDPGETLQLAAADDLNLFLIGLPPIETPLVESQEYDEEEMPGKKSNAAA